MNKKESAELIVEQDGCCASINCNDCFLGGSGKGCSVSDGYEIKAKEYLSSLEQKKGGIV